MSIRDVSKDMLHMPALGRYFDLGTIYDAIKDEIITGHTFWNENALKNVKTERKKTELWIIASDKLTEKFEKLKVNGSLQISILGGNIELAEGLANYLNKKRTNTRQSSIHVKFQYNTAIKKLTMDQLDESNLNYTDLQTSGWIGSATHVVTQIQYGAEATFTFTKTFNETEDEQEVNGQLKLSAEKFLKCLKGNANVSRGDLANKSKGKKNNIECHFQGDFQLPPHIQTPTTYEEAIIFAKKFIQLSTESVAKDAADGNRPLGVPISVWLYPLVLMKDAQNAPALRYEISSTMASECVQIMQNYEDVEDKVHYMLGDPLVKKLSPFQKKLKRFQQYLTTFLAELKMKLREMIVDIRSGKAKVDSFSQLLNIINDDQNFPFNANHLDGWMKQKHKELCMMKRFQDEAKSKINNRGKVNFLPSTEKLQEQMTKYPVEFGFELTFTSLAREEIIFQHLNQTLKDLFTSEISTTTNSNDELWFESGSVIERIQKEIDVFAKLANNYSNDKKFAFAITSPEEYKETCASQFSIIFHNKQKRIFVPESLLNVLFQNYPKEKFIDVVSLGCDYFHETKLIEFIRLIVEDEISEDWNQIPLLALCRHYNKENLIDIVRLLIDKNIDVNCKIEGWNALLTVCRYYERENLIDIVRLLIGKNIDVNCKDNNGWNTLLEVCRYYKKENLIDIVRLLINKNIDVNCKTDGGNNALTLLCQFYSQKNLIDIVRLLIGKNIDVNCKNNDGWNALNFVCRHYNKENLIDIIRLLINKNIDVNCKIEGWNALLAVCRHYGKENLIDIVRLLIDKNTDVNCKNNGGDNAITLLCQFYSQKNLIDIVRLLIERNINVNCKTNDGWNALLTVCRYYNKENLIDIVQLLIETNIDVQCKTNGGWNALNLVCRFYDKENLIEIVRLLIENNMDVNCRNNDGWNALHLVCYCYSKSRLVDLVRLLVRHKIDKKVKTTGDEIGTARSFLLNRFKEEIIKDVLQILDS